LGRGSLTGSGGLGKGGGRVIMIGVTKSEDGGLHGDIKTTFTAPLLLELWGGQPKLQVRI